MARRDPRYDPLFEPIRIGPKVLKNRFYQVPQCTGAGPDRPGANAAHRAVKAEGGWAALNTEACNIHPESDQTTSTVSTMWDAGDVINHRHMTDAVHRWNALAGIELCYGAGLIDNLGLRHVPVAMYQFASPWMPQTYTHEADVDDLVRVQDMYSAAARRAVDAGFDIVYVHGTHGCFPIQALSRYFNRRTDRYGGSFENRARFWLEVLERLKRQVGEHCAIATRFSIDQLSGPQGVEAADEGLRFVELVMRQGLLDLLDVNISSLQEWGEDAAPSRFQKVNHQAPWTRDVRSLATVPVVGVGRFTSPDDMLKVVTGGQLDIIGCARPSIADPWLPRKIDEGRVEDIRECIGCNQCIARFELGGQIVCTQNATVMEEYRRDWHPERFEPAPSPDLVLVVGAGPAGLECAHVLARRGYRVHLIEAEAELGGHLRHVARLPGLAEWARVIDYRVHHLSRMANVEIMRGAGAVRADDVLAYGAAKVVLATGSSWERRGVGPLGPDAIAGADAAQAAFVTPEQLWAGKEVGRRVLVLDGDGYFMGVSIAELLADRGHGVTIVTQFDKTAPLTDRTLEGPNLHRMMREKGIAQKPAYWVENFQVRNDGVRATLFNLYRDGARRTDNPIAGALPRAAGTKVEGLDVDTVILCTARRSNDALARALKVRREEWARAGLKGVYQAGDCYAPRYLADAVFDGHRIARELESQDPQRPKAVRRERQLWGQPVLPSPDDPVI
ncbi:MAG: FAD-dependent oxidoreductase [Alphaproteobacteria bacterium]